MSDLVFVLWLVFVTGGGVSIGVIVVLESSLLPSCVKAPCIGPP